MQGMELRSAIRASTRAWSTSSVAWCSGSSVVLDISESEETPLSRPLGVLAQMLMPRSGKLWGTVSCKWHGTRWRENLGVVSMAVHRVASVDRSLA